MAEIPRVKITNVSSLSTANATTQQSFGDVKSVPCAMCRMEIPFHKLKVHIFVRHFPFYRPYHCKKCAFRCGSVELYLKEHTIFTGHSELEKDNEYKSCYVELLVNMFYQHSLKLYNGQIPAMLNDLSSLEQDIDEAKKRFLNKKREGDGFEEAQDSNSNDAGATSADANSLSRLRLSTQQVRQATDSAMRDVAVKSPALSSDRPTTSAAFLGGPHSVMNCETLSAGAEKCPVDEEEANLFANFSVHSLGTFSEDMIGTGGEEGRQIITQSLDALVDEKNIPVFSNIDGVDREKSFTPESSTSTAQHTVIGSAQEKTATLATSKAFAITCEFCQETCLHKDLLRQHLLDNHCGGFQGFYCSGCEFKSSSQRQAVNHCRTVHKNTKLLKRAKPTAEEFAFLKKIKMSLDERQIDFDLAQYENLH